MANAVAGATRSRRLERQPRGAPHRRPHPLAERGSLGRAPAAGAREHPPDPEHQRVRQARSQRGTRRSPRRAPRASGRRARGLVSATIGDLAASEDRSSGGASPPSRRSPGARSIKMRSGSRSNARSSASRPVAASATREAWRTRGTLRTSPRCPGSHRPPGRGAVLRR